MGSLSKVKAEGPFIDEWKQVYNTISNDVEEVDIAAGLSSAALSVKDEKELRALRDASRASSGIMANFFVDQMSGILDEEKKISHKNLSLIHI